jgi:hypothetical protein
MSRSRNNTFSTLFTASALRVSNEGEGGGELVQITGAQWPGWRAQSPEILLMFLPFSVVSLLVSFDCTNLTFLDQAQIILQMIVSMSDLGYRFLDRRPLFEGGGGEGYD